MSSGLTPEQAGIVEETDRPVLVQAGPGSGKTKTLVAKFVHLVERGVPSDQILALTFSNKAAAEMRHRIETTTKRSYGRLWVSTFHSFGHTLLSQFATEAGVPRRFHLLTGFKEWVLVRDVLAKADLEGALANARALRGLVGEVANALGALKQALVSPGSLAEVANGLDGEDARLARDLASVYRAYEAELRARRHLDFRDLIAHATRVLETRDDVRQRVQSMFRVLLLDELQDIDRAQVDFVKALVRGSPLTRSLTAFGDLDQSIYSFRGAIPGLVLSRLSQALEAPTTRTLERNFRARPPLIALSRRVLAKPGASDPSSEAAPPLVTVRVSPSGLAEATAIARQAACLKGTPRLDGSGVYRWSDITVLCRSIRRDGKVIESELERLGIPYRVHGNSSFYRNPAVAFLVNYLIALVDEENDTALRRVLASPVPSLPAVPLARFLDRVSYRGRHAGRYFWFLRFLMEREDPERFRVFRPDRTDEAEAKSEVDAEREQQSRGKPPYFYALMSPDEKQAFYDFHQRFLILRARARRTKDALPALVAAIATRSGLVDWILKVERADPRLGARHAANLSKLHAMVAEYTEIATAGGNAAPTLEDLAAHLRELLEHWSNESEVAAPDEDLHEPEDAVSVMTIHAAKGLESDVVFVPNLVTGHFPPPPRPSSVLPPTLVEELERRHPGFRAGSPSEEAEHLMEERRLFYVAVTRARERLYLSWARRYASDEDECSPSPFLVEALGGSEQTFWRDVHESEEPYAAVVARIAAGSRSPAVTFHDDEATEDRLDEVASVEDLEIELRRIHARGDDLARSVVERVLRDDGRVLSQLDKAFVLAAEPFPREQPQPLRLDPDGILLSASRLGEHRDCPRKFFYSKLLHLEPGTNAAAAFGTVVHEVLQAFHDAHQDREELAASGGRATLAAELRHRFEEALAAQRESVASEFEHRRALADARGMVEPYLDMLGAEPLRFVAGRELELEFRAAAARVLAKIDRVCADSADITTAREILIADYKTVREANPRGLTLKSQIEKGEEIQLVTYYQAFAAKYGRPPSYLGKIFLRHRSEWRAGTLQVLLRVTAEQPEKGDDFRGRRGQKWVDRAWISPEALDQAWAAILERIGSILSPDVAHFAITPSPWVCERCPFGTVCGKEEHESASDA